MNKKTATKKPNPQDATLRNIRALKRQVSELKLKIQALDTRVSGMYETLGRLLNDHFKNTMIGGI